MVFRSAFYLLHLFFSRKKNSSDYVDENLLSSFTIFFYLSKALQKFSVFNSSENTQVAFLSVSFDKYFAYEIYFIGTTLSLI